MNKKLVVDSSVIVKWINKQDEKLVENADQILQDARENNLTLIVPELAKYEVGNALLKKKMELPQTLASLSTIYSLPIKFVPLDEEQALRTTEIAQKSEITFYDATFLALAEKMKATLITDNPKHQGKFDQVKVISLKDYK